LNRPELTAEKFVPNPYSDLPGARLYRSGDLARYLHHGELEFLGRVDQQVKVRGYRIELGEIETVLAAHPDVRECVVVVRPDATGDRRLAAYVVAHPESQPTVSDLRQHMMQKLPEYMSPNSWVLLDALPLTANGKVDRKALPEPEHVRPKLAPVYVAPQTDTERKVAEIWQRVLQIENAGINDNFFDLGGHSLLLVKVHNELRAAFPREIQLVELLQYPTISSVADYLSQEQGEQSDLRESHERTETRKRLARQQRMKRRVNAKGVG
jgi:acyl carrier protein